MTKSNMLIWDRVEQTDPSATLSAKVNGQQITSIKGHHMVKKATEVFGPIGIGWGYKVTEERFDQGGEIRNDKNEVIGREVGHVTKIELWYELDGKRGTVEQYGCTPFTYKSKWGVTTDTEAPKKSLTDAMKKALSMIGFSADIFLGMYDDGDYVAERKSEAALEHADNKEAEIERQKEERLQWLRDAVETMASSGSEHELKKLHTSYVRTANRRNEDKFIKRLTLAFDERMKHLSQDKEVA